MTPSNKKKHPSRLPTQTDIEKSYIKIIREGKEQLPGINELLELYGQFEVGFKQSQDYLQLTRPILIFSASNSSSPSPGL